MLQANPDGRKHAEAGQLWRKNVNENYCEADPDNRGRITSVDWISPTPRLMTLPASTWISTAPAN